MCSRRRQRDNARQAPARNLHSLHPYPIKPPVVTAGQHEPVTPSLSAYAGRRPRGASGTNGRRCASTRHCGGDPRSGMRPCSTLWLQSTLTRSLKFGVNYSYKSRPRLETRRRVPRAIDPARDSYRRNYQSAPPGPCASTSRSSSGWIRARSASVSRST